MEIYSKFKELGIEEMGGRIEDAEDENIPFSKFDTCYVSTIKYYNGKTTITKNTDRTASENFQKAYEILKEFDYEIDMSYYNAKREILENNYRFKSKLLPSIDVCINLSQEYIKFQFTKYNSIAKWVKFDDMREEIYDVINSYIKNKPSLNREFTLRKIIDK